MLDHGELDRIERTLRVKLPPVFRDVVSSESFSPSEHEWFETKDDFLELNTTLLDEDGWNPNALAFAGDGAGNYYCIELDTADVLFWHHEDSDFAEVAPFSEWIASPSEPSDGISEPVKWLGLTAMVFLLVAALAVPMWFAWSCSAGGN